MIFLNKQYSKFRPCYDKVVFCFLVLCICISVSISFFGNHQATAAMVKTGYQDFLPKLPNNKQHKGQKNKIIDITFANQFEENYFYPNYELNDVISGTLMVPRLFLTKLPKDLKKLKSIDEKKEIFIKSILPLILLVNEEIEQDRSRIKKIMKRSYKGKRIKIEDMSWLNKTTAFYKLELYDFDGLLFRHDIVPPSLALAQAIIESGWGTSRFAQLGNAVFGQWTFQNGAGIVPRKRDQGDMHEVKSFDRLEDSVKQYAMNLNKHNAYKEFRHIRAEMRAKQRKIDGYELAWTMKRYSELGKKYVRSLHVIIESNSLLNFDMVRLKNLKSG